MDKKTISAKIIYMLLAVLLCLSAAACGEDDEEDPAVKIAYMKDVNGYEAGNEEKVTIAKDFLSEHVYTLDYIETKTVKDAAGTAKSILEKDYSLIISTSYTTSKALSDSMNENVTSAVLTIGYDFSSDQINSVVLKHEEAAFFGGIIAATESESKKIAYLGGYQDESNIPIEYGFYTGAYAAEAKIKISSKYVKSFNNPSAAEKLVSELIADGVDVVFTNCGASALGIASADKEKKLKVICASDYRLEDERVITYLNVDIQPILNEIIGKFMQDKKFEERIYEYGYFDGVFTFDTFKVSEAGKEVLAEKMRLFSESVSKFTVPKTEKEFEKFDYKIFRK